MASTHFVPYGNYQCKNCNNAFEGIVCNVCGQHPVQEKLTLKVLWKEWRDRRKYDSKSLFKTMIALFLRPGDVIGDYLNGKRHTWYNAVNFFLLAGTLAAFVTLQFSEFNATDSVENLASTFEAMGINFDENQRSFQLKYMAWIQGHYNIILLLALPFMALASWIIFRKRGYSLGEHLIMHCYGYGLINFALLPFLAVANPFLLGGAWQIGFSILFIIWYTWIFKKVFNLGTIKSFLIAIFWYFLYFFLIIAISLITGLVIGLVAALVIIGVKKTGLIG